MSYNSTNTGAEIQEKLDKIVAATTLTDGLMSASDKTKLDNLITAGTSDLTAGSSALASGRVYLMYE